MKVALIGFFIVVAVVVFALAGVGFGRAHAEGGEMDFLRLHIRANSNTDADQAIKYVIKQNIVDELNPIFASVKDKGDAMNVLAEHLDKIKAVADKTLSEHGFRYGARAAIRSEKFPVRNYTVGDTSVTLPKGVYDALILDLGNGVGDNWFCVVYPPLCLLENNGGAGVQYRFKLFSNS